MAAFGTFLWWLIATPLMVGQIALSVPIAIASYGNSFLQDGQPVDLPFYMIEGPRYYSVKTDYPFTDVSAWAYYGDEVEGLRPDGTVDVDESTWATRWDPFPDTADLRGDERGSICRLRRY